VTEDSIRADIEAEKLILIDLEREYNDFASDPKTLEELSIMILESEKRLSLYIRQLREIKNPAKN